MKNSTRRSIAVALSIAMIGNSVPVWAAEPTIARGVSNNAVPVSDRLIVKYKANNLPKGLTVAQVYEQLRAPLTAQTVAQLQTAAGVGLKELEATTYGAHVLTVAGQPNRQALDNAIAGISSLPNVEYVEEDKILTAQMAPNDPYYTSAVSGGTTYPGLWAMWPATTVTSPAPGGTGSYGADFQTAWDSVTGSGIVVAVVDTGITPNVDIVGTGGTVAAGTGSNLVSTGYDFITDCRTRATCAATTTSASAVVAASAGATDQGDFITAQDKIDNPNWSTATVANSSWHGTHVAGTIAALGNNSVGVIGGAYNAKILPVRVLGKGGGYTSDIANGILWAAGVHSTITNPNPAKVINLSLGGQGTCSTTLQTAINSAVSAGAVVVVAAGNSNADVANYTPANCSNVITVAAVGRDGSRAQYSNYSSPASNTTNPVNITLAAPGGDQNRVLTFDPAILSTVNSGTSTPVLSGGSAYSWLQGTSMAAPHVSAAVALMLSKNSALTPAKVKSILSSTVALTAFPSFASSATGWTSYDCATLKNCGTGILNAKLAVQNSIPTALQDPGTQDFGSVIVNGSSSSSIRLWRGGVLDAPVGTATITGTNASMFSITSDTCSGQTVSSNCVIGVKYSPTAGGVHTASLNIPVTGASSTTIVSLTGTSIAQLTTANVTAPTVAVGQSTSVNVSFTNPNAGAVTTLGITLSQPSIMALTNNGCSSTTLAGGASCSVTVAITPNTAGAYSGTISLSLRLGGGIAGTPNVATISGTATAATSSSGGGGGGCAIMPFGATPDASLLLAMLAVAAYWLRRRVIHARSAD